MSGTAPEREMLRGLREYRFVASRGRILEGQRGSKGKSHMLNRPGMPKMMGSVKLRGVWGNTKGT